MITRSLAGVLPALTLLVLVAAPSQPLRADEPSPTANLLRLVPDDIQFCIVVQGLRDKAAALAESPALAAIAHTPLGKAIAQEIDNAPWQEIDGFLRLRLDLSLAKLRDDFLGDAVVVAFRGPTVDEPDREQGLVLMWVRDPAQAQVVLGRLEQLPDVQRVDQLMRQGQPYLRLTKTNGATEFFFAHGSLVGFATDEAMLRTALDREQAEPAVADQSPWLSQRLEALGVQERLAVWWWNPRAFDGEVEAQANGTDAELAAFLAQFRKHWQALDGAALFVDLDEELEIGIALEVRRGDLPISTQRFLHEAERASALWQSVPDDALIAIAGCVDGWAFAEMISSFLTDETRQQVQEFLDLNVGPMFGKAILPRLARSLGPDWGTWVAPPPDADRGWFPEVLFALRIRSDSAGEELETALKNGLDFLALLAVMRYNRTHEIDDQIQFLRLEQDNLRVSYLANDGGFAPGFRPAFAVRDGYLIVAAAPESVLGFRPPTHIPAASAGDEVPLFRLSFTAFREYVQKYEEVLAHLFARANGLETEEVTEQLGQLQETLSAFDHLEVIQQVGPNRASWVARLKLSEPLIRP